MADNELFGNSEQLNDTISRQAAIDAIMCEPTDAHYPSWYAERLEQLPSAQPEIIRCKDCKYASMTYSGECKYCARWNEEYDDSTKLYLDGDFYCGFAERKTDERFNQQTGGD